MFKLDNNIGLLLSSIEIYNSVYFYEPTAEIHGNIALDVTVSQFA